jgi:hypothetical protein
VEYRRDDQHDERQQQNVFHAECKYHLYGAVNQFQRLCGKCILTGHHYGESIVGGYGYGCHGLLRPIGYVGGDLGRWHNHGDDLHLEYRRDNQHDERQQQNVFDVECEYHLHGTVNQFQRLCGKCIGTGHDYGESAAGGYSYRHSGLLRTIGHVGGDLGRRDNYVDDLYVEYRRDDQHDERQQQNLFDVECKYHLHGTANQFQRLCGKCILASHHYGASAAGRDGYCHSGLLRTAGYVGGNLGRRHNHGDDLYVEYRWDEQYNVRQQ